jgi:hypothetical protein
MKTTAIPLALPWRKSIILDAFALAFIYFIPSLAHLIALPVYMIEPMRVMLILSLAHSTRVNSWILALTLPLFSWTVSGHPEFAKMLIISTELALNVFLFYILYDRIRKSFPAILISIVLSKAAAYIMYWVFFSWSFVLGESDTLFLVVQLLTTLIFSFYVSLMFMRGQTKPEK